MMRSGLTAEFRGQAIAVRIDPDRIDAEALRHLDFPFQIVADHPGLGRRHAQRLHGVQVGALVRLAETMLAFDLDVIEPVRQRKALDLGALGSAAPLVTSASFTPRAFRASMASCAPGKTNISSSR